MMRRVAVTLILMALTGLTLCDSACSQGIADKYDFTAADGMVPRTGLTLGLDGFLYGGMQIGGASNAGNLFKFGTDGTLSTIYSFAGLDGSQPFSPLTPGPDGTLYGTTVSGGASFSGEVYAVTPLGVNVLHSFSGPDGRSPSVPVTIDSAGNIYGVSGSGGAFRFGTVYKMAPDGTFQTLHSFTSTDGQTPSSTVAVGPDGTVYGTTRSGGQYGRGIVFALTPGGVLQTLHSFNFTDGSGPRGTFTFGPDGALYGVTSAGGDFGSGTFFRITTAGDLTTLHSFNPATEGQTPGFFVLGNDANYYGTLQDGGPGMYGGVYALSTLGSFTSIWEFADSPDGANPTGGLAALTNGSVFGLTMSGGANSMGCMFEFSELGIPDTIAPVTTIDIQGPHTVSGGYTGDVTVTLSAVDTGTGVASTWYTVDGRTASIYNGAFGVSGEANHTVSYWSVDWAGNREATHTIQFPIDLTPPVTTSTVDGAAGDNGWYVGPVTITLAATDNLCTPVTHFILDGGPVETYSDPYVITANGVHTFAFWSVDNAGNMDNTQSLTIRIDSVAPDVLFGSRPNASVWSRTPVSLSYDVSDAVSGVASASPASPLQFTLEGAGQSITVTAVDIAGNSVQLQSPVVNIDMTPPSTVASVDGSTVTLLATDALSGVASTHYTIDGGSAQTYSSAFTVTGVGTHTMTFWSVDVAGNIEAAQSLSVTVAPQGPVLTSLSPDTASPGRGTWVTLSGSGFRPGSIVAFGWWFNTAHYVSPTEMRIYVWPIELVWNWPSTPVTVVDPDRNASNTLTFNIDRHGRSH